MTKMKLDKFQTVFSFSEPHRYTTYEGSSKFAQTKTKTLLFKTKLKHLKTACFRKHIATIVIDRIKIMIKL